jgi:hypothetical protein
MAIDPQIPFHALSTVPPFDLGAVMTREAVLQNQQAELKLREQTQRENEIKLQEMDRQRQAQDAIDTAYRSLGPKLNAQSLANHLAQAGYGHLVPAVLKSFADMDKAGADLEKVRTDTAAKKAEIDAAEQNYWGMAARQVLPWLKDADPSSAVGAAKLVIAKAVGDGHLDRETGAQISGHLDLNPETLPKLLESLVGGSKEASTLQTQAATQAATTADRAATRKLTAGHYEQTEAIARGQLAVAQGNLAARRAELAKGGTSSGGIGVSPSSYAVAVRWKEDAINQFKKGYTFDETDEPQFPGGHKWTGGEAGDLTDDEFKTRLLEIENQFRGQVRQEPAESLEAAGWKLKGAGAATPEASSTPETPTVAPAKTKTPEQSAAAPGSKGIVTLSALREKAKAWGISEQEARARAVKAGYDVR